MEALTKAHSSGVTGFYMILAEWVQESKSLGHGAQIGFPRSADSERSSSIAFD
jgi:hypothetical protein